MDVERVHYVEESPADIKAAEKLAKLHDELRAYNEFNSDNDLHDLNIFITRLLFVSLPRIIKNLYLIEYQIGMKELRIYGNDLAKVQVH